MENPSRSDLQFDD